MYIYKYQHTYMHIHIYINIKTYIIHMYLCIYIHIYTHTYVYAYKNLPYTCVSTYNPQSTNMAVNDSLGVALAQYLQLALLSTESMRTRRTTASQVCTNSVIHVFICDIPLVLLVFRRDALPPRRCVRILLCMYVYATYR